MKLLPLSISVQLHLTYSTLKPNILLFRPSLIHKYKHLLEFCAVRLGKHAPTSRRKLPHNLRVKDAVNPKGINNKYKVVQICPGQTVTCLHTNQCRSYLNRLVLLKCWSVCNKTIDTRQRKRVQLKATT